MFMNFIIAAGLEKSLVRPPWQYVKDVQELALSMAKLKR